MSNKQQASSIVYQTSSLVITDVTLRTPRPCPSILNPHIRHALSLLPPLLALLLPLALPAALRLPLLHVPRDAPPLDRPTPRAAPHPARDAALLEYVVDVLELEPPRLREERVDERDPERVEDGEDDEHAPVDVRDRGRRHLDDSEDAHPVEEGGDGGAARADARRRDL